MSGMLERLGRAWNAHDAAQVASLFADDYESVQPLHPDQGPEQGDQTGPDDRCLLVTLSLGERLDAGQDR